MGTSAVQDDPMLRLRYYQQTGQSDEATKYEQYLRDTGQFSGGHDYHAEYRSGALAKRMQAANARDMASANEQDAAANEDAGNAPLAHLLNTAQGLPGMEAGQAWMGVAGSHLPGNQPMNYGQSLAALRDQTGRIGGKTSAIEKMAGSTLALPFLPANPVTAGAIMGGAGQLLDANPDQSIGTRLGRTAAGAALGGGLGYVLPGVMGNTAGRTLLGAGTGAYLAPSGHKIEGAVAGGALAYNPSATASLTSQVASKAGASRLAAALQGISDATGTPGVVNREMEGIDRLLKPLGSQVGATPSGAPQKLAQTAMNRAESGRLYDVARQDTKILNDPQIRALVNDPDMQAGFKEVQQIRNANKQPVPQVVTGQQQVPSSLLQPNGQPFTKSVDVKEAVPDPEALHLLKRITQDRIDAGYNKDNTASLADAYRLQPKLATLRELLHDRSPDYQAADRFMHLAMTGEEALGLGYGAVKPGMRNPSPRNLGVGDVSGARAFIDNLSHADPAHQAALQATAQANVQAGAKSQLAQQIASTGVSRGRAGALAATGLDLSGPAAQQRALALGADAPAYEGLLGNVRAEAAANNPKPGLLSHGVSFVSRGHLGVQPRNAIQSALESPKGQSLLADVVRDPTAYQSVIDSYRRGALTLKQLQSIAAAVGGSMIGRQ